MNESLRGIKKHKERGGGGRKHERGFRLTDEGTSEKNKITPRLEGTRRYKKRRQGNRGRKIRKANDVTEKKGETKWN